MSILSNIGTRARLIRTALTKRFVYHDIVEMAVAYGHLPITDVYADQEPISLLRRLGGDSPGPLPDFSELSPISIHTPASAPPTWSSERNAAEFVGRLASLMRAKTICEVGCFIGYTTTHLATALRTVGEGGHVHYVDLDPQHLAAATSNLKKLGLSLFGTPHLGGSYDPQTLSRLPTKIDLAFVDTTHGYLDTVAEIAAYGPRLSPNGCLVLHDAIRFPEVRQAITEASNLYNVFTFATERGNGISVLTRRV